MVTDNNNEFLPVIPGDDSVEFDSGELSEPANASDCDLSYASIAQEQSEDEVQIVAEYLSDQKLLQKNTANDISHSQSHYVSHVLWLSVTLSTHTYVHTLSQLPKEINVWQNDNSAEGVFNWGKSALVQPEF